MKKQSAGFTLIEVIVTLALVSLVVVGGFRLYFFADRSFVSGAVTADIQADIQLATQRIVKELEIAHGVQFVDEVPNVEDIPPKKENSEEENDVHYLFVENGLVILRTHRGNELLTFTNPNMNKYELNFSYSAQLPNILEMELLSLNPKVPYSLETAIRILNLRSEEIPGNPSSGIVKFSKTISAEEREEAELVSGRCLLASIFDDTDPDLNILRGFRDKRLRRSPIGRELVYWYYKASPYLVDQIKGRGPLVLIIRKTVGFFVFLLRWQKLMLCVFFGFVVSWVCKVSWRFQRV